MYQVVLWKQVIDQYVDCQGWDDYDWGLMVGLFYWDDGVVQFDEVFGQWWVVVQVDQVIVVQGFEGGLFGFYQIGGLEDVVECVIGVECVLLSQVCGFGGGGFEEIWY